MTSKEALEELKFQVGNITYFTHDSEGILRMATYQVRDSGLFEIIAKSLEVLEILKNNEISISYIQDSSNYNEYIEKCDYFRNLSYIKEEEYNKLKKWLENEVKYYKR